MAHFLKKKVYLIGGSPDLVVYGDIEPVFAAIELIPLDHPAIEPVRDAVRIFFLGGQAAYDIPVELSSLAQTVFESGDVHLAVDGALRIGTLFGRAQTVVRIDRKLAVIVIPGLRGLNIDFISRRLFRPVLDELLAGIGYITLHAAGVAAGDGGCIITGPAGSGKTSLLYGLLENGFGFLADDRILIRKEHDNPVMMYAFPEYIRLAINSRAPKRLIVPPDSTVTKTRVKYILFLQGGKHCGKMELLPVGAAEAAARLLQSISLNTGQTIQQREFELIGDSMEDAKAFRLSGWGNGRRWVSMVSELLLAGK